MKDLSGSDRNPPSTIGERLEYLRGLRVAMTVMCFFFAVPIWAAVRDGAFGLAACMWFVAEVHFWLCSITPTEQWLKEHRSK